MGGAGKAIQKTYDVLVKGETPQAPAPLAPPPPPPSPVGDSANAKQTNEAMEAAAAAERKARGRSSTLLTGAQGLTSDAPTSRRMLLGS